MGRCSRRRWAPPGVLWAGNAAGGGKHRVEHRIRHAHGLAPGQAITSGGEIRFVAAIVDPKTVVLNAPFSVAPGWVDAIGPTATYSLATQLPSVSIFDYWDPSTAVQRVLCGAAVDQMTVKLNGDFHQFEFKGMAQDLIDSASFQAGQGGATTYPPEPALGVSATHRCREILARSGWASFRTQFFTVSAASIEIQNDLDTRSKEFGTTLPLAVVPGMRSVSLTLELFEQDDAATTALYQAAQATIARQRDVPVGTSAGSTDGDLSEKPGAGVPQFDDSDKRLQWKFTDTRAQGTAEDEIVVAFG